MNAFYLSLQQSSPVAVIIISVSLMLMCGFLMTRITKKLRLPNVTAYIITGILLGPFCLDMIPANIVEGTEFLADIALAFIAFSTGEFFKLSSLKKNTGKVLIITLFESLLASLFIFVLMFFVLRLDFAFSLVLSALASATAPASTMMTIRQTKAKGDFVDTLLQVVAYDDIVALFAYSITISVAMSFIAGETFSFTDVLIPLAKNFCGLIAGGIFGVLMKLLVHQKRSTDNRLIVSVAILLGFCGICSAIGISPLLGCMSMGTVYINLAKDDKLFKQLNYFSPPILLLFFVRSGVSFDLNALVKPSGSLGGVSLIVVGVCYFVIRIAGKYLGAFAGCAIAKKPSKTRNVFGLALIPQAGVAIGLASLGARALGGEMGNALETVILASSVLYELIGPALSKLALYLSGSYSSKLEDITTVPQENSSYKHKTEVEILIERIEEIQSELNKSQQTEEEKAFTEAAEKHFLENPDI